MSRIRHIFAHSLFFFPILNAQTGPKQAALAHYGDLPLAFEENKGQTDARVKFLARTSGSTVFVTQSGLVVNLPGAAFAMKIAGANPQAEIAGESRLPGLSSYFSGSDPSRWVPEARQFGSVRVKGVRPGIDLVYYGNHRNLEYDLVLAPGTRPETLRLRFEGARRLSLDAAGDLVVATAAGDMIQRKPRVFQINEGRTSLIDTRYRLSNSGNVGFIFGAYNRSKPLVIDPVLSYATYLGGLLDDRVSGIAIDPDGNAYVTGATASTDFPITLGAYRSTPGGAVANAFVSKLNPSGTALIYSTFLGPGAGSAIVIDPNRNAYIVGSTNGGFPVTAGAFKTASAGGGDAFVAKLSADGASLVYSTYLGGSYADVANAIAIDASGDAFVAGTSGSSDFPTTPGAYSSALAGQYNYNDGFVTKLNPSGSALLYSTLLGGTFADSIGAIAVDGAGIAYVTGSTASSDFPVTAGALKTSRARSFTTGFVTAIRSDGSGLVYSTYLGGSLWDGGTAIAVDSAQNAYITGFTSSTDFPVTPGAFRTVPRPALGSYYDAFVAELNSSGSALVFSTYLGGQGTDTGTALALDKFGNILVAGQTSSTDFPFTQGSFPALNNESIYNNGGTNSLFLTKLAPNGASLAYSTDIGGSGVSAVSAIAVDGNGNAYLAGYTNSKTFPATPGAVLSSNPDNSGTNTGFLMKVDLSSSTSCALSLSVPSVAIPLAGGTGSVGVSVADGCPWEVYNPYTWITLTGLTHGIGNGTVSFSVAPNYTSLSSQQATIQVGPASFAVSQPAGSCAAPAITPLSLSLPAIGASGNFSIQLPPSCSVLAVPSNAWLNITSGSPSFGSGTIGYSVATNDFAARSAVLNVNGVAIPVTQSGGACTASFGSSSASFPGQGGTGSSVLTTSGSNCHWNAYSFAPWIQVTSGASGVGSSIVGFAVAPNYGSASRGGQIYAGGQVFTVLQTGGFTTPPASYVISTVAGNGYSGYGYGAFSGDTGPAIVAALNAPTGVAFDPEGNLYISDASNYRIRKVGADGIINTVVGTGASGSSGDGGPGISATISSVPYLSSDAGGNIFFSDEGNHRVRELTGGNVVLLGGTGTTGNSGDGGPATSATFMSPAGISVDNLGNVYLGDITAHRVRKISSGNITAFAGTGTSGHSGDNGPAIAATMGSPQGVATDAQGNVYISEPAYIRKVSNGIITTIAGGGSSSADGVPATSATISARGIAVDSLGDIFFSDAGGYVVRRITPDGLVSTIAGNGLTSYQAIDGVIATSAPLMMPQGIAVDSRGNIAIADAGVNRVRLLIPAYGFCAFSVGSTSLNAQAAGGPITITITNATGCAWNAFSNASWISFIAGVSGMGNGSVALSIAPNGSSSRSGSVNIAGQTITITQPANSGSAPTPSKVAVYQPSGNWAIDANGNGQWDGIAGGDRFFNFTGGPGDIAIVGDWNGDGHAKAGIYHNGFWLLDYNGNGQWDGAAGGDRFIALGGNGPGEIPVVGDWNGDGRTKIGFYYNGFWALDYNGNGQWDGTAGGDRFIALGSPGSTPVVGDWNGDGRAKVGYFNNGSWALDYNGNGQWDGTTGGDKFYTFSAGAGDIPLVGDWSGSRTSKIGVYHQGFWLLDTNGNGQWDGSGTDTFAALGGTGYTPVVGDWNGDGRTKIGFYTGGFWALDYNGNGQWDGTAGGDRFAALGGAANEQPVVGKW